MLSAGRNKLLLLLLRLDLFSVSVQCPPWPGYDCPSDQLYLPSIRLSRLEDFCCSGASLLGEREQSTSQFSSVFTVKPIWAAKKITTVMTVMMLHVRAICSELKSAKLQRQHVGHCGRPSHYHPTIRRQNSRDYMVQPRYYTKA